MVRTFIIAAASAAVLALSPMAFAQPAKFGTPDAPKYPDWRGQWVGFFSPQLSANGPGQAFAGWDQTLGIGTTGAADTGVSGGFRGKPRGFG
jgi:hypothetical protein